LIPYSEAEWKTTRPIPSDGCRICLKFH